MPASRFECPRCQTVFVKDIGGDAAFVECPSCGALALPAGDATEGDLSRALSGPQPAPPRGSTEGDQPPAPSDPAGAVGGTPGLFAGLLDDATALAPTDLPPPPPPPAPLTTSPRESSVTGSARAPELDFDFGGLEFDLPAAPATSPGMRSPLRMPSNEASSPFSAPTPPSVHSLSVRDMAALAEDAEAGPTSPGAAPWSNHTLSEEAFGDLEKAFDEMALRPQPAGGPSGGLSVDEERFLRGGGDRSGANFDLSGEASGARTRPPPLRDARGEGERSERTGRPEAPPSLPPKRASPPARSARRSTHFQLSDEAKRLAFLPLVNENSGSMARQRQAASSSVAVPRVDRVDRIVRERVAPTTSTSEETDLVRDKAARSDRRDRKPVPSAFQGLSVLRAVAIVIVCGILGGVGGALTAPPPKTASTPRARAELRFADGNRFYDAQRYDDALGAFRATISIDPTFALAHRAKGAAFAKLNRPDEAATAYQEYLKLEPTAVDVADVKAALLRREGNSPP